MNFTILILIIYSIYLINFIESFVLTDNSPISATQSDHFLTTITPPSEFKTEISSSLLESEGLLIVNLIFLENIKL